VNLDILASFAPIVIAVIIAILVKIAISVFIVMERKNETVLNLLFLAFN
jgi:hypothetical protein